MPTIKKISREKIPLPLYYQLKESLKERIQKKEFPPSDLIPSEFQLMEEYEVSRITVVKAISELLHEGWVYRKQGKGTFVNRTKSNQVGLLLTTEGHVYETIFREMVRALQEKEFSPTVIDTRDSAFTDEGREKVIRRISQLVESGPTAIIADGALTFPVELLDKKSFINPKIIFAYRFERKKPLSYPYHTVTSDFFYGGYLAVKHLLELGHRKILFFTILHPKPEQFSHFFLYQGVLKAFKEKGLNPKTSFPVVTNKGHPEEHLTKIFSSAHRPTAVFTYQDHLSTFIFRALAKLRLKVPKDVSIVGYYNTPWAEMMEVPLTSVSICPDKIARLTTDIILNGENKQERRIIVKPKLIIRESCGCQRKKNEKEDKQ